MARNSTSRARNASVNDRRRLPGSLASVLAVALLAGGLAGLPRIAAAEDAYPSLFDFGTDASPVAAGWTQVTQGTLYTSELGYGITELDGGLSRDRGSEVGDEAVRDWVGRFSNPWEFKVDLPNGNYELDVVIAEMSGARATSSFAVEGVAKARLSVSGGIQRETLTNIAVTDGQLNLVIGDSTGHLNSLAIRRVDGPGVEPTPEPTPEPSPEPSPEPEIEPGDPIEISVENPLRLDFGTGDVADGYVAATSQSIYSPEAGYGFANAAVTDVIREGTDPLRDDLVAVESGTFVVNLPNLDYTVSLISGDRAGTTEIQLTAELQNKVQLTSRATGEFLEMNFDIALVDGQLTLEFGGESANLNALVITPHAPRPAATEPTLYLTGDSTVQTYDPYWVPQAGWGQMLDRYFPEGVSIDNQSIGGRSSKTFITEGRLDAVLREIRPGDYLFAQFGHNDATISVPERYASPEDYKGYLRTFVEGARQRDATPILVTPVSRLDYNAQTQTFNVSFAPYVEKMLELAEEIDVDVVDLSASSRAYLDEIGFEAAHPVFLHVPANVYPNRPTGTADNTHFQEYGAIQMARLLAQGVANLGLAISPLVEVRIPDELPGVPTGLRAVAVTNASVTLDWAPVEGADVYRIYRAAAGSGEYALAGTSTIPYAQIGGLSEGESYELRVSAVNALGEGEPSESIAITTRAASLRFDFGPAGSPIEPEYIGVTRVDGYTAERRYGFGDATSMIDRDRGESAGNLMQRDFVASFNVPYEFMVDVPNGAYAARITVGDSLGTVRSNFEIEGVDRGALSISRNHTTGVFENILVNDGQLNITISGATGHLNGLELTPVLVAPTGLQVDGVDFDDATASVGLSWTGSPDAATYAVYRDSGTGPERIGTTAEETFVDTEAMVGLTYTYTVTAVTAAEQESVPSIPVKVDVIDPDATPPSAPTGLRLDSIEKSRIAISWGEHPDALFYTVYRSDAQHTEEIVIGQTAEPRFVDDSVLTTIAYTYRVAAVNAGGVGAQSDPLVTEAVTTLQRQAEYLDRAPVAVVSQSGVYLGWRMLGLDPEGIAFNVYRDGERINDEPLTGTTNLMDAEGSVGSRYRISAVVANAPETWATSEFGVWAQQWLDVPLDKPADAYTKDGQPYTYRANDASVADVDGDGTYEILLKWDPSNSRDNSQAGYTGNVYFDAYKLDGTKLWRIDMGPNIRAGAHYSMPMFYDLDGDGKAELVLKTADGTVDGTGAVVGDASADWRNSGGYVLSGPEFLTVFDGQSGAALDTVEYTPARGDVGSWGDTYGNRVDRFLAAVAYLDGETPSVVFSRGYYTRTVLAAYDFDGANLTSRWVFDSATPGNAAYAGQGNHNLSVADVDGDGKDEIIFGSMAIDDDGTGLYSTGLGHGDAMHVTDHIPSRPGLEVFAVHESMSAAGNRAATMRDAATGEIIWASPGDRDTGRGAAADIDPRHSGNEAWHIGGTYAWNSPEGHMFTATGEILGTDIPAANFVTWWDGDLLREITDHRFNNETGSGDPVVHKWDWNNAEQVPILEPTGVLTNNHTKGTPSLQADLFGDWREELMFRTTDSTALRVFTTTDVTEHRIRTLMHDPDYRLGVAWQNVSYNQPPHPGFFLGEGMAVPPAPSIVYTVEPPAGELVPQPDETRAQVSLVSPTTAGPFRQLHVRVDATDNAGLRRIVANIYQNGRLVRSTQSAMNGAANGTHDATVTLPSGSYTLRYNAEDLAGNISRTYTFDFAIDATAPTATIKEGANFTVATGETYDMISFKLYDAGRIDKVTINGVEKNLTDNTWSDVNFIRPGVFGAVKGENTMVVYDVAGNTQTHTFVLN